MTDMMQVWKEKIDLISEKILSTEPEKDGRLRQLNNWKSNLEMAYLRCLSNKI